MLNRVVSKELFRVQQLDCKEAGVVEHSLEKEEQALLVKAKAKAVRPPRKVKALWHPCTPIVSDYLATLFQQQLKSASAAWLRILTHC